jgi:hypothetical protein
LDSRPIEIPFARVADRTDQTRRRPRP